MKIRAVFENKQCLLEIVPEDEWEKRMLGSVAGKTGNMSCFVEYKSEGHYSYQSAEIVKINLKSTSDND